MSDKNNVNKVKGFTLIEVLITLSILGIVTAIAMPNISDFIIKTRVDNEISSLHRLILNARNAAVNTGKNVTVCPLSNNTCAADWTAELTVFTNDTNTLADNSVYNNDGNENNQSADEKTIKVRPAIMDSDTLSYDATLIIFSPTGRAVSGGNSTFTYCPSSNQLHARSLYISLSGRVYASEDSDNNGIDEDRNDVEVSCD
jgi:type IV fimbrial biogenesis protein FimT/type IV fimbrial biogenesis protein FimU